MIFGKYSGIGDIYAVDDEMLKVKLWMISKKLGFSFNHYYEIFRSKQMNKPNKAENYFNNQRKKGRR
ncbi:hypothetical protein PUR_21810 [Paenibacillus sp. URB8-2]|nr:hypothetical protein PUR_21810 [Paenibacillus sp. URB8-2]